MWRPSLKSRWISPSHNASSEATPVEQPEAQVSFRRRPPLNSDSDARNQATRNETSRPKSRLPAAKISPPLPLEDDPSIRLNKDLKIFAAVYTDVKIEVLRELLWRFDGDSRLQISMEQLIKHKSKWTEGRLLSAPRSSDDEIPIEDLFRSRTYLSACKRMLSTEFKSMNRGVIDAVLGEVNHSYSGARPILQKIAAKSWRATVSTLLGRKKVPDDVPSFLARQGSTEGNAYSAGDVELDRELEQLFFAGPRRLQRRTQERADAELANVVNEEEAESAQALFECQVCYHEVPFENIVTCTDDAHVICRTCIRLSLKEAIFGQSWSQSVDMPHGTLRCVASDADGSCEGHIPPSLLEITILSADSGLETWIRFAQRLAADNLMKSGLDLVRCPFCDYAEAPQTYVASSIQDIKWRFRKQQLSVSFVLFTLLAQLTLLMVLLLVAAISFFSPNQPREAFHRSLAKMHRLRQSRRFRCKHPSCLRTSCLSCSKAWHDPHICHEPLIISLRTAVEAARTAALKRTCPRCGMSFIKLSGCNKLVCVCGYAMCYICRKNIGKTNRNTDAVDDRAGGEGYRHFCEHFRLVPGDKCSECNKCDLYEDEDEARLVDQAGKEAEREWREREGMVGVKGLGLEQAVGNLGHFGNQHGIFSGVGRVWNHWRRGDWTMQDLCDGIVEKFVVVEVES